jgi:hypothetical protein
MKFPFEASFAEVEADLDNYISAVISSLESDFLVLPRGRGFIDFAVFEDGYEFLKRATHGFKQFDAGKVLRASIEKPVCFLVVRSMLGFTPPEWAHIASARTGMVISQGHIRTLDRRIRMDPERPLRADGESGKRLSALVGTACELLAEGAPAIGADKLHRLDKVDTRPGGPWIPSLADTGVSYAMLLYERFLGRPFAGHRDSVSELVGDALESAIESILSVAGISFRKTKRAERVPGFDQAPDFIIPSAENPAVVIEAKLTEDDGTARDKVTRIQHLDNLSTAGMPPGTQKYEVIACISGRGFAVRRSDMKKLLLATHGKVFTLQSLNRLVDCTKLKDFRTRRVGGA